MAFVEMKDVYKRYRTGEIVTAASDGINFTIEKGEFAIIVGPSGAGKTTVLNILGGMDTADEGQVLVDGNDICLLYTSCNVHIACVLLILVILYILHYRKSMLYFILTWP